MEVHDARLEDFRLFIWNLVNVHVWALFIEAIESRIDYNMSWQKLTVKPYITAKNILRTTTNKVVWIKRIKATTIEFPLALTLKILTEWNQPHI